MGELVPTVLGKTLNYPEHNKKATPSDPNKTAGVAQQQEPQKFQGDFTMTLTQTTILDYIAQLLYALRLIADQCDGAREDDGVGFNGCDASIGRDFARLPRLSFGQAIYAAKMLQKYRRTQLQGVPLPNTSRG